MKKLLLLLLLIPSLLSAQRTITKDSTYLTSNAGTWFQTRVIQYDNGESNTAVTLIGDTATLANQYRDRFSARAATLANDARSVSGFTKEITGLIRQASAIEALIGDTLNPIKRIGQDRIAELTDPTYEWYIGDSLVVFSITNAKQVRYRIGTMSARNAQVLGEVISLVNYPLTPGGRIDLFRQDEKRYQTLAGDVVLRRVKAGSRARSSAGAVAAGRSAAPPAEPQQTITNAVIISGAVLEMSSTRAGTWKATDGIYQYTVTRKKL